MVRVRKGEAARISFERMPDRCKEMFFECLDNSKDIATTYRQLSCVDVSDMGMQSPIEMIFYYAFDILKPGYLWLEPQYEIITPSEKKYVCDFVFDTDDNALSVKYEHSFKIAIECDGFEYHRTKQQMIHDNLKDLALKKMGYDVLHFSGSQIYNEPWKCAKDAIEYINQKIGKVEWFL